jgi:hypothetical protein
LGGDAGADVDGDATDLAVDQLALARVEPGPHLDAEIAHRIRDSAGAADRAPGYVAAKRIVIGAPSDIPRMAARRDPAASITARTSSIRVSS